MLGRRGMDGERSLDRKRKDQFLLLFVFDDVAPSLDVLLVVVDLLALAADRSRHVHTGPRTPSDRSRDVHTGPRSPVYLHRNLGVHI